MKVHTYEKLFLTLGATLLVACGAALVYASTMHHIHLPGREGTLDPQKAYTTPPFDKPGVRQTGPNAYDVTVVAQAWAYLPAEIRVPANADVTITATSADIIHGFYIEGTRVNMMLIPGQVSRMRYRFTTPGERRLLLCHEYCGMGHHTMSGRVIIDPPTANAAGATSTAPDASAASDNADNMETMSHGGHAQ